MGTPVDAIEIEGFKSIARARIELRALNVLIGANGSGKSNFVSVFDFLLRVGQRGLQHMVSVRGGPERFLRFGRKTTAELRLVAQFRDVRWEGTFAPTDANQLLLTENTRGPSGYQGTGAVPQFLQPESDLADAARRDPKSDAALVWRALEGVRVFHFHDVSREARIKQPVALSDDRLLHPDGGNLAAILLRMQKDAPRDYERVLKTVRLIGRRSGRSCSAL
jgi:predicted ATPase